MTAADPIFAKAAWRLFPFIGLLYTVNFLDRVNVGFAALTMNRDVGLSAEIYGAGAGIFFIGYFLCEVPSNLMLERVGARLWIFRIMLSWGIVSAAMAFARGPVSFAVLRFLLGVCEAGFFPGIVLYLTYWFPASSRARFNALFLVAIPIANIIGSPLSGWILGMNGTFGLHGWQWLFLVEGAPSCLLAFAVLAYLPDNPSRANWLSEDEKRIVAAELAREAVPGADLSSVFRDPRVWLLAAVDFGIVMGTYGLALWLPQIVKAMGYSNLLTGFLVAVPYAFAAVAMLLWARSSDARGERIRHAALAALVASLGFLAAALMRADVVSLLALSVAAMGIYAALATFWTLPPSFLGGTAAAGGIAFINSLGNLGGFAGPALMGWLKQQTGNYSWGMVVLAIGLLASAAVISLLPQHIPESPGAKEEPQPA